MHLSCDLTIKGDEGKAFEWVLFIRTTSYTDAVRCVEQAVAERWRGTMRIEEMFVSPDHNSWEKQAAGDDDIPGVYATREPRELVRQTPLLKRIMERLCSGRE